MARFEQQVRRHGPRLAAKSERAALTYDELNRMANRVAHAILAARGPAAEPVALLFQHDVPMVAAMLGVLKAGKFYVPLDPLYPRPTTVAMLEASEAELLVADGGTLALAAVLAGGARAILDLDAIGPETPDQDPGLEIGPDAYALLLFTSGSTGRPKGIVENHRNMLEFTRSFTNDCHVSADDRMPLLVSCCFTGSVSAIYNSLLNGASLHLRDPRVAPASGLAQWLVDEGITIFWGAAPFSELLRTLTGGERFPSLRLIYSGGQPLLKRDFELYRRHFSDQCLLANGLGTTEKKSICRYFMDKQTTIDGPVVPIGYPVENTRVYLLDEAGRPVGVGEVGEITVASRYIAPAFWRDPELTRATFRPVPGGEAGERVWRTGDLGRMRPDGCLEHLGRKGSQVKIRGHRFELAEVETALVELPEVAEAAVVARGTDTDNPRLVAYVVPATGEPPTVTALREALAAKVPAHMLPSAFVTLASLPRNPNGKVDRAALPEPGSERPNLANAYVAPRTPLEALLASIWADLLGLEQVGIHDDFLALGGDSLLAARVISRVRDVLRQDLSLEGLFQAPTVADQAAALLQLEMEALPEAELARLLAELDGA